MTTHNPLVLDGFNLVDISHEYRSLRVKGKSVTVKAIVKLFLEIGVWYHKVKDW